MRTERQKIYHLLIIHDFSQAHSILLQEPEYTIGRDPDCSIVINNRGISREHAFLRQVPKGNSGRFVYELVDGSASGTPSRNGIKVNNMIYQTKELEPGDQILLGTVVSAEYTMIKAPAELALSQKNPGSSHRGHHNMSVVDLQRTLADLSSIDMDIDDIFWSNEAKAEESADPEDAPTTLFFTNQES